MAQPFQDYGISFSPAPSQESEPISLSNPSLAPTALSDDVATRRAFQTEYGLGDSLEVAGSELKDQFVKGQETAIRQQAALKMDYENRQKDVSDLRYVMGSKEGALDPAVLDKIKNRQPVNPETVIENAYTQSSLSALNTAATSMGGTVWTDALVNLPVSSSAAIQVASDFGTKRGFLQTQLENAGEAKKNQGWPSYLTDEALQLSQVYTEAKERDWTAGGIGLSSNIKSQADESYKLDNDNFAKFWGPRLKKMIASNPSLAEDYITKLLGESDKSALLGNLFTFAAPVDIGFGVKGATSLAKRVFERAAIEKATQDVLQEAKKKTATPSSIQAAAGDLGGSAVNAVSEEVIGTLNGGDHAVTATMNGMTSNFQLVADAVTEGSPKSREVATRLRENLVDSTKDIPMTILEMNKVNRTPLSTAVPENLNAIRGEIRTGYRGPWGSLLDVHLNKDSWNQFTNTWDYHLDVGNMNGEYFRHPETAKNFARDNGLGEATIIKGEGPLESDAYAQINANIAGHQKIKLQNQDFIEKQTKILQDKAASVEQKKEARGAIKTANESIKSHEMEIARLEAGMSSAPNTQRLGEIKKEIAAHQAFLKDAKEGMPKELRDKVTPITEGHIKTLQQEMRALNYGQANAIPKGPVIKQQGVGYFIRVTRPLDETQPIMRDLMIKNLQGTLQGEAISDATSGISSWKNAIFGKYRSPEDTLSKLETQERKAAVYSKAVLEKLADGMGQYIEDVARGRKRFREDGTPIPWYLSTPRYVAGLPYKYAKNLAGDITGKNIGSQKQIFQDWERAVDYARRAKGPDGKEGWFFQNQGQLEDYYLRTFQRMPSYAESLAYFSKVELDEFNRVLTNIAVYRNKSRIGTMSHQIIITDGTTRTASAAFDGVQRKDFGGSGNVVVMDNTSGKPSKVMDMAHLPEKLREDWTNKVSTGKLKFIELWDPEQRPLSGFGNVEQQRVRFVLVSDVDSKPIAYNQVNRRGGGHFDYEYDNYLKQAVIRREEIGGTLNAHYEGDMTVMALANRAMGKDIAGHMDTVRQLIKENRIDEARDYTRAKLMMEFDGDDGLHSWFKPGRDANGKVTPPRLNLDEKFHVVPKGKNIFDIDGELERRVNKTGYTFQNGTNSGSLARQFQVAYTRERDAYNLIAPDNIGTSVRPLYKYEPAKLVDALPTMQRALNTAMKSTFMDDYKMMAVEHWLREAEPWLKEGVDAARSSPFYHFHNPVFRSGIPREVEKNLEFNRQKIIQFIGIPSEFDTTIHALTQKLVDGAYERGVPLSKLSELGQGKQGLIKTVASVRSAQDLAIVPIWMLNRIHDPITKLRSLTYNFKLGLFNVPQILVQAQTHANIWALAGRNGGAGTYASFLHSWSRFGDDAFLRTLDNYATKINFAGKKWKPGEFFEARKELARTGFEHVSGEYAILDDQWGHKYFKGDADSFLSAGQQFFKEGERYTRWSAWYTAYKEFREASPIGALTKEDRASILQRADLLTVNMSRASSSALHTGVLSLSTQFLSYQMRLAELFMGKRLGATPFDRAMARMRLFGTYAGLYGVPAAFGLSGLPVSEDFRAAAIDYLGYVPGENWLSSLAMEGIPSLITALVSGEGDITKGNFYNIGDRYGAQGFTQLREALRSDGTWYKILGGAGVSTLVNTITNMDGLTKALVSFLRQDSPDERFKLKLEDVIDAGKEISSVNSAWRLIIAMNTGKWVNKNEQNILPVSERDAAWMSFTGLSHQEQDDIFTKGNIIKSQEGVYKYAEQKFTTELHRSIEAKEKNNPDQAHDFIRRAFSYLEAAGVPFDRRAEAIAKALHGWEGRAETADFSFYLKNVPINKQDQRLQTYKNIQKRKYQ